MRKQLVTGEEIARTLAHGGELVGIYDEPTYDMTIDGHFDLDRAARVLSRLIERRVKQCVTT